MPKNGWHAPAVGGSHKAVFLIGFLDLFGVSLILPLMMLHIKSFGASSIITGFIGSIYGSLQLFSSPVMGGLSDRKGRKLMLTLSLFVTGLNYIFLGISTNLILIVMCRMCTGIFKHSQMLSRAYLADITQPSNQANIFGKFNAWSSLGFIMGPIVGGHLAELSHGFFWVCFTAASLFFINTVIACIFLNDVQVVKDSKNDDNHGNNSLLSVFHEMKKIRWQEHWDHMASRFLLSLAVIIFRTNFTLLVKDKFAFSSKGVGYIISLQAFISAGTGFFSGKITKHFPTMSSLALCTAVVETLVLAGLVWSPNCQVFICLLILLNINNCIARICFTKITLERGRKDEAGALAGVNQSITGVSRMLAPLMAGFVQDLSVNGPGVIGTISAAMGMLVLWVPTRQTKLKLS